jgi:MFS family permease
MEDSAVAARHRIFHDRCTTRARPRFGDDAMTAVLVRTRSLTPLVGNYPAAVSMALVALCPFIVLSTATLLITQLSVDLHASAFGTQLAEGLSDAGYAFGAVAAADLTQRLPAWRVYVLAEAGFAAGSLLAGSASGIAEFTVGRVMQGIATGMLLVVALPPLLTRHGAARVPLSAAFVNLGLFGMVTLGPVVGGIAAADKAWRLLFFVMAGVGAVGVVLGLLAFERNDARSPGMGFDWSAIPVALVATALPFFGVSWLSRGGFGSPAFYLPVAAGLLALGALMVRQYRKRNALMPLKLISHTLPVTGIATAMVTGAVVTALVELAAVYLLQVHHESPAVTGTVLGTQMLGVVAAALLFKRALRTRWLPALALCGLGVAGVAGALLLGLGPGRAIWIVAAAGVLLGFAAGAGVTPGLFMAGLSVPSGRLGPAFAMVELLRSEAAFLVAPIIVQIVTLFSDPTQGIRLAVLILVLLSAVCGALILAVLLLGGVRPHAPDLERWVGGEQPAYHSPRLAAAVRHI